MRKVTVLRMRERYAQTVLTFRITYVYSDNLLLLWQCNLGAYNKLCVYIKLCRLALFTDVL